HPPRKKPFRCRTRIRVVPLSRASQAMPLHVTTTKNFASNCDPKAGRDAGCRQSARFASRSGFNLSGGAVSHWPSTAVPANFLKVAHRCRRSEPLMDLVTLVTACALGVEPKLMHALIWHQSGGEPWAVAEQNEAMSRGYSSMQDAVSEVPSISIASDTVRVGLAGLPVSPLKA